MFCARPSATETTFYDPRTYPSQHTMILFVTFGPFMDDGCPVAALYWTPGCAGKSGGLRYDISAFASTRC